MVYLTNMNRERLICRRLKTKYLKMITKDLESSLGKLSFERFDNHNIEYETEYRIASRIYTERTRMGRGLIFHMKQLCGNRQETY